MATLERIYYAQAKLTAVNDHLYGENGISKVTDAERENYYKENYYCADWIYVYTKVKLKTGENGELITDQNGVPFAGNDVNFALWCLIIASHDGPAM